MAKYSFEFKMGVVQAYLNGEGGYRYLANKYSISAKRRIEEQPIDTSAEHIKELEDALLKLRIENAYLKELRRLRLEEETLLKKQRESSTVSEDSSN